MSVFSRVLSPDDTSGFVVMRILAHVYCMHMSFVEEDDDVAEHCFSVESFVVNAYALVLSLRALLLP